MSAPAPAAAITRAAPSSASTIAVRSNGTRPRSSRMKAAKASSISRDEPSARAQRFAASSRSTRRPSWSRSALGFRGAPLRDDHLPTEPVHEPADDRPHRERPARAGSAMWSSRESRRPEMLRYATTRSRRGSGAARAASQGRRRGRSGARPPRPGRRGAGGSACRARTEDEGIGPDDSVSNAKPGEVDEGLQACGDGAARRSRRRRRRRPQGRWSSPTRQPRSRADG